MNPNFSPKGTPEDIEDFLFALDRDETFHVHKNETGNCVIQLASGAIFTFDMNGCLILNG